MAKELARKIGYSYIDTGAMYRAVTLYAWQQGCFRNDQPDMARLEKSMGGLDISFEVNPETGGTETYLNGTNVEREIRKMEVANQVSFVATLPFVRNALVEQQRRMGKEKGVVMDGRDIGTVVFPDAELKVFVTASPEIRAFRRWNELKANGEDVSFEEILENIKSRDHQDMVREIAPLRKAGDAIELDNTNMTLHEQNEWLINNYELRITNELKTMKVEIDPHSGFCFGVVHAIESAERELKNGTKLYCLGDIVHNSLEMDRIKNLGLQTIKQDDLPELHNKTVLLRAHGEPPSTYEIARDNHIQVIDATCPVVLHLQRQIKDCYQAMKGMDAQLVIYGKQGHAEVNGLVGQTEGFAIVIDSAADLERLDFSKEIALFSQTTKSLDGFLEIVDLIRIRMKEGVQFRSFDTICRQVANRLPIIKEFVALHDWVYFVAGQKSSNGKMLFEACKRSNPNIFFISSASDIQEPLPLDVRTVGVCGATSTPKWLMEEVANRVRIMNNEQ